MSADTRGQAPLAILAKAPIPGRVKTRLMPALDAEAVFLPVEDGGYALVGV